MYGFGVPTLLHHRIITCEPVPLMLTLVSATYIRKPACRGSLKGGSPDWGQDPSKKPSPRALLGSKRTNNGTTGTHTTYSLSLCLSLVPLLADRVRQCGVPSHTKLSDARPTLIYHLISEAMTTSLRVLRELGDSPIPCRRSVSVSRLNN
ncbi:hypothetical protein LZ31DRAFT_245465 [Colletotrichum somersetense]|nr:hypothetical protein LZ31DRAFT_245465 [Colletotrichum somersetense]